MIELNVRFTSSDRFVIKSNNRETDALEFVAPVNDGDRAEIRDYLEKYTSLYMMDVDDRSAERTEAKLPLWGAALFEAIFSGGDAKEIFKNFQDSDERDKILTISASHPLILSLPWELLCDSKGTYLSHGDKPISIRRSFSQLTNESEFKQDSVKQNIVPPKNRLRLLFVVSRPIGAGFLDPRKDALATLEAIAKNAQGLIDVEFLRPATLDKLVERLADKSLPSVDIVHFDGHGVFDVNKNIGYLLFEDIGGNGDRISAAQVGESLSQAGISAMLLSACQSAAVAGEEAMGSVAAGLTHAGIPTVLAMQYSVLTSTTEQMFGAFYEYLTQGQRFGEALENARRDLYAHRERGDRQRGRDRVTLRLQDWFLPALYQVGSDRALFAGDPPQPPLEKREKIGGNLSELQKAGFWGRAWELWQIERAYVRDTRRVTISGFGGMGKTYLAEEAGRWLLRTGMFARVCLVGYANFQGIDAVSYAVSVLATVLETNLIDAAAVTRALADRSVLVILDNLESLDAEQLVSLLDAAKEWSEAGGSRLLLTTRTPDLHHPDYQVKDPDARREKPWLPHKHVSLQLEGLRPDDAVNYFQSLLELPPAPRLDLPFRNDLLALFELVQRLPLAIGLLAAQLKDRQVLDVRKELEELMVQSPDNPLLASLNLSINRLYPEVQEWIKCLGVFQGSAMEPDLLDITGITKTEWCKLKLQLESAGLIQTESLTREGVGDPFFKFHPALSFATWCRLTNGEQQQLLSRHCNRYYNLSSYLYFEDIKYPIATRAIVLRELPNFLYAVNNAIGTNENFAADFVTKISKFFDNFGLNQDREKLTLKLHQIKNEVVSKSWFLVQSNLGEKLLNEDRYAEAKVVFQELLAALDEKPNYERCLMLGGIGRCYEGLGQIDRAETQYLDELEELRKLDQTNLVKRETGLIYTDLGNVLIAMGQYNRAHDAYRVSLAIAIELEDLGGQFATKFQIGTLALLQKKYNEAFQNYQEILAISKRLKDPISEATAWYQLGMTSQELQKFDEAERAYRNSAQIREAHNLIGGLNGAASTWNQLAILSIAKQKPREAEEWFRKTVSYFKDMEDKPSASKAINNLATVLEKFPESLNEAKQLAEEALNIQKTIDPVASEIWLTYDTLAKISDKQGNSAKAKEYRQLSRSSLANFADTQNKLQCFADIIVMAVMAVYESETRKQLEIYMQEAPPQWQNLIVAIRQILNGQRDEDILCTGLDIEDSQVVLAILRGISDPETLQSFLK